MLKTVSRRTVLLLLCLLLTAAGASPLSARVVSLEKDQVNIRQDAGTSAKSLGLAEKGTVFGWTGDAGGWTQIRYNGGAAYIRNDMLRGFDEVVVTGTAVRIRQTPSLQAAVLGSVNKEEKLAAEDYRDGWYKVRYGQGGGWISADYVKPGTPVDLSAAPDANVSAVRNRPSGDGGGTDASRDGGQSYPFDSATVSAGAAGGVLSGKVITLDPGHGTYGEKGLLDPGALSANLGLWERDVNLDVALKLRKLLTDMGATVWMTHTGATNLDLYGRAALPGENGSQLFVSIHANSSESVGLNGHSVYYYAPADDARLGSQRRLRQTLARQIQNSMVALCGRADLGIKESNFVVLRETDCPSVLVETAYMSHKDEEVLLAQGAFRQKLADAVALGIMQYFGAA